MEAQQVNLYSQPLSYAGLEGLRFDKEGKLLPHCILGSLDDFRSYLEAKGETELIKKIPEPVRNPLGEVAEQHRTEAVRRKIPTSPRNKGINALRNWDTHIQDRRQQQNFLSDLLSRPAENLLMNQTDHLRPTLEQKEYLKQGLPAIQSGYGYRVGSEFWSLPQHYGDEMSGITSTLSQTEQGRREPITHIGQPNSILQESGISCAEPIHPASQIRKQRSYLQHQLQQLREVFTEQDFIQPDISGLEVIGSGQRVTFFPLCQSPLIRMEENEKVHNNLEEDNLNLLTTGDGLQSDDRCIAALKVCGQLATWTGNSPTNQGEVGIKSTLLFETITGEFATSCIELQNEGSTVFYFNWQKIPIGHSFPDLCLKKTKKPYFYFNCFPGVILPGETRQVEIIFKSEDPGIKTELWQLNTHPLLLQGASILITLRGVAMYRDHTADQRLFLQNKLDKLVTSKMCRSIVEDILQSVHSPERPSSPTDPHMFEEQQFLSKNPALQFARLPVENLKKLWEEASQEHSWDFSVDTLHQAMLSLPDEKLSADSLTREEGLSKLNRLFLQLSGPCEPKPCSLLTSHSVGMQLMRNMMDMIATEAKRLRNLLGLPQNQAWTGPDDIRLNVDADMAHDTDKYEEKRGATATEEKGSAVGSTFEDDKKGASLPVTTKKTGEKNRKLGKTTDKVEENHREKKEKDLLVESPRESVKEQPPDEEYQARMKLVYKQELYKQVYCLMEELVDNLCDVIDELNREQGTHGQCGE